MKRKKFLTNLKENLKKLERLLPTKYLTLQRTLQAKF